MKHFVQCALCQTIFESQTLLVPLHGQSFQEASVLDHTTLVCLGSKRLAKFELVPCALCEREGKRTDCAKCNGAFAVLKEVNVAFEVFFVQDRKGMGNWQAFTEDQARREIEALQWLTWEEAVALMYEGKMINVNTSSMLRIIQMEEEQA